MSTSTRAVVAAVLGVISHLTQATLAGMARACELLHGVSWRAVLWPADGDWTKDGLWIVKRWQAWLTDCESSDRDAATVLGWLLEAAEARGKIASEAVLSALCAGAPFDWAENFAFRPPHVMIAAGVRR